MWFTWQLYNIQVADLENKSSKHPELCDSVTSVVRLWFYFLTILRMRDVMRLLWETADIQAVFLDLLVQLNAVRKLICRRV